MDDTRNLERSLLATLNYFDLFDYPLTLLELARYRYEVTDAALGVPPESRNLQEPSVFPEGRPSAPALSYIAEALTHIDVQTKDGYYFLPGREAIVATRLRRQRIAEPRFRRARTAARWIGLLPSVRLVAVSNSLALSNAEAGSDIDLFVVTRPGTIWATRLIVVGALALLGLRPSPRSRDGKICMCFFVTERAMDLSRVAISPDDPHFRYWISAFVPMYDAGGAMQAFLAANAWVAERLPAALVPRRVREDRPSPLGALLPLMRAIEPAARAFQRRKFPRDIRERSKAGNDVIINDDMLKFHLNDRRAGYERLFRERLATI